MSADLRRSTGSGDASGPVDQPRPADQPRAANQQPVPPVNDQAAGVEARRQKYAHLTEGSGQGHRPDQPARRAEETGKAPPEARQPYSQQKEVRPPEAHAISDRRNQTPDEYQKSRHAASPAQHPDRPHAPGRPQLGDQQPGMHKVPDTDKPQAVDKSPGGNTPQGGERANGAEHAGTHPYPEVPQQRSFDQARPAEPGKHPDGAAVTHLHWEYQGTNTDVYTDGTRSAHLYSPTDKPHLGPLGSEGGDGAKGEPAALPHDVGRYLSTGDRQAGISVVGERPDKSPGDTSDLPPAGDEFLKPDEEGLSPADRFGREMRKDCGDVSDTVGKVATSFQQILDEPSGGHAETVVHEGPAVGEIPQATPDAGAIAELGVVGAVIGWQACRWVSRTADNVVSKWRGRADATD